MIENWGTGFVYFSLVFHVFLYGLKVLLPACSGKPGLIIFSTTQQIQRSRALCWPDANFHFCLRNLRVARRVPGSPFASDFEGSQCQGPLGCSSGINSTECMKTLPKRRQITHSLRRKNRRSCVCL